MNLLVIYSDDENQLWYYRSNAPEELLEQAKRVNSFALGYTGLTEQQEDDAYDFLDKLGAELELISSPQTIMEPTVITNIHRAL